MPARSEQRWVTPRPLARHPGEGARHRGLRPAGALTDAPAVDGKRVKVEMEAAQLATLLDGIDLNARRLARWNPPPEGIDTDPGS